MTQMDLALLMEVRDKSVSHWERDRRYPRGERLTRLARVLGVSVSDLLGERTSTS